MEKQPATAPSGNDGPTPQTRRLVAWRRAVAAFTAEDAELAAKLRAKPPSEQDYRDPVALWFGLFVLVVLLLIGWFTIDTFRCDPRFSDHPHSFSCRAAEY